MKNKLEKQLSLLTALVGCLLLLGMVSACGPGKGKVRIKGHFREVDKAELYIYAENGGGTSFDTIKMDNGRFDITLPLDHKCVMTILFPNFSEMYIVGEPEKTIDIEGEATNIEGVDVAGSDENKLLTKFRQQNVGKPAGDQVLAAADFIRTNPKSVAAEAAFLQYFVRKQSLTANAQPLLELLTKSQPDNTSLRLLSLQILPMLANAPGARMSAFSAKDINGADVSPSTFSGKPLLVYFFAQWENANQMLFPELRALHRAYGDRLGVLGISLDYSKVDCGHIVKGDTLPGRVVCDGQAMNSPLVKTFGFRYMPAILLFDASGRLVARDIAVTDLRNRVGQLF